MINNKCCHPILIIEDDDAIRETMQQFLELEGFSVATATNGQEGLRKLGLLTHPCVILLDLFMPVMNGFEFLAAITKNNCDLVASIPVVIVSAAPPQSDEAKTAKTLASGFIRKPINLEEFLQVVKQYCGN